MAEAPKPGLRPILLAWVFLAALTGLPYLRASLAPPPGTTFVGFFYFVDDAYNYLSYVQQAEAGSCLFKNKLLLEDHPATLINLEWWLIGRVSAGLGGGAILAYRIFALLVSLAFLAGADRWLRACGLRDAHRLPALLLVSLGGGLGGLAWRAGGLPLPSALDLATGLFPFVELLANPHFVAGTALLVWSLWAFFRARTAWGLVGAGALGTITGLVRPYDLVLLAAIRAGAVLLGHPPREWIGRLLPLLGLAPVALYNYWVFYVRRDFATFYADYTFPGLVPFAWALGPAVLLALTALVNRPQGDDTRRAWLHLAAWLAVGALVIALNPVTFSLQFLVGIGLPLLAFGALGLARWPSWVALAAGAAMASTPLVALGLVLSPNPRWYVPPERMQAALAFRASCRAGDLALSPPDIGLYVGGLTACRAYVSHSAAPGFESRAGEARYFFEAAGVAERARMLDRLGITHLALPGDPGVVPAVWLGESTPFRRIAQVGKASSPISLYAREGRGALQPSSP